MPIDSDKSNFVWKFPQDGRDRSQVVPHCGRSEYVVDSQKFGSGKSDVDVDVSVPVAGPVLCYDVAYRSVVFRLIRYVHRVVTPVDVVNELRVR